MTLLDACREVMSDPTMKGKYPDGLAAADILNEIRIKHGEDAFPYVSLIDVCDEMEAFYGQGDRGVVRK